MRRRSPISSPFAGSAAALLALIFLLAVPQAARAGGSTLCACCYICIVSERLCPDSEFISPGQRSPEGGPGVDASCCTLCAGDTCRSAGVTCTTAIQNRTKYELSGNLGGDSFGLSGGWQNERITTSTCSVNPKPTNCSCVACESGLVHTVTTKWGVESCLTGNCNYSGSLRELTGCYQIALPCACP